MFDKHKEGVGFTTRTRRAVVLSDKNPTIVHRYWQIRRRWCCSRCLRQFSNETEERIPHTEFAPRAPGEAGLRSIGAIQLTKEATQ
jgi:hypothetical protein